MIQVFNNPFLADFLYVASQLPQDEREQIEAMNGVKYEIDGVAVGNYMVPGPKWVIKVGNEFQFEQGLAVPIVVGGFVQQRPGVWQDFLLTTPMAFLKENAFHVTRACKRAMDAMLYSGQAHRLECIVPAARVESRPELVRWYKLLGYNKEGLRYGYCANGADAIAFSRVRH